MLISQYLVLNLDRDRAPVQNLLKPESYDLFTSIGKNYFYWFVAWFSKIRGSSIVRVNSETARKQELIKFVGDTPLPWKTNVRPYEACTALSL
jgi:hypothetical protein